MVEVKEGRSVLHCHDDRAHGNDVGAAICRIDRTRANQLSRSGEPRHGKLIEGTVTQMYSYKGLAYMFTPRFKFGEEKRSICTCILSVRLTISAFQPSVAIRSSLPSGAVLPSAEPCACDPGAVCDTFRSSFCGEDIANYPLDEINVSSLIIVHTSQKHTHCTVTLGD